MQGKEKSWFVDVSFTKDCAAINQLVKVKQLVYFIRDKKIPFKMDRDTVNSYLLPYILNTSFVKNRVDQIKQITITERYGV